MTDAPRGVWADLPVIDGHNDLLGRMYEDPRVDFFSGAETVHISREALQAGGMAGGFFAIFVPPHGGYRSDTASGMPPPERLERGRRATLRQMAIMHRMLARPDSGLLLCRTAEDLRQARAAGQCAVVLHLEGAEGISRSLDELDVLHAAGLRSIGPVWSRRNRFGSGAPIFGTDEPQSPPGLTALGIQLVERAAELGMVVDLSHMTEAGFWQVAGRRGLPLVATHSNARSICDSPRNLSREQLRAIGDSGGMVGLNFATIFLRPDRGIDADTPVSLMLDHLRALIGGAGIDHVALGSDFDGAVIPRAIASAAGLPVLLAALERAGFSSAEIEKIAWRNWWRQLSMTLASGRPG